MENLVMLQTNAINIYALNDRLTLGQTQLCLQFAILFCVLGFLLAEYNILNRTCNWFVGLFTKTPQVRVPSHRRT